MRNIFSMSNLDKLSYALDVSSVKSGVIAENIANVDTPGYKSSKLVFDEAMTEFLGLGKKLPLAQTNERHFSTGGGSLLPSDHVRFQNNPSLRNDGNDVNMDYEMSQMSANSVLYQELTQLTAGAFTKLKTVIQGR